ncbi:MAG: VOC family protein [Nitrospirae bacterium]|nr:VOC family protein [Nitrospirota bacterium]
MAPAPPPAPLPFKSLRHLALRVTNMAGSRAFYEGLLGMKVIWEPDPDNVYLSAGADNLALHQIPAGEAADYRQQRQFLDHFGFIVASPLEVDQWHDALRAAGVPIIKPPTRHRDSSVSCYIADPDGNVIQFLYEPTLSEQQWVKGQGSRVKGEQQSP